MRFEYEIPFGEYASAQKLYWRLSGHENLRRGLGWIFAGIFCVLVAWTERNLTLAALLLLAIGGWWIYGGAVILFSSNHLRRGYKKAELAGHKFAAEIDENGFRVDEESCSWSVKWSGVPLKGENQQVFILYAANTVFMFGKRYLRTDQQQELRRLMGLASIGALRNNVNS